MISPLRFIQAPMQLSLSKSLELNPLLKIVPLLFLKLNFRAPILLILFNSLIVCFTPLNELSVRASTLPFYPAPYSSIRGQPDTCSAEWLSLWLFSEKSHAREDAHPLTGKAFSAFLLCVTLHGGLNYVPSLHSKHRNCNYHPCFTAKHI